MVSLVILLGIVATTQNHLAVAPLRGNPALYTGMYGTGLVVLLLYSTLAMKERVSRLELAGAVAVCLGTLTLGLALVMGGMVLMQAIRRPAVRAAAGSRAAEGR
jgi:drug/metabolite transporter (DMT)-like permease